MIKSVLALHCLEKESSIGFTGYGWPAALELLKPLGAANAENRRFKMILCLSCNSVHELGGIHPSPHRQNETDPANSTTDSVKDFWLYYHGRNESMLKDQFNPFVSESIPPLLVEASAEGHDTWGWCPYPCARTERKESLTIHHGTGGDGDFEGAGDSTRLGAEEARPPQGERVRFPRV